MFGIVTVTIMIFYRIYPIDFFLSHKIQNAARLALNYLKKGIPHLLNEGFFRYLICPVMFNPVL